MILLFSCNYFLSKILLFIPEFFIFLYRESLCEEPFSWFGWSATSICCKLKVISFSPFSFFFCSISSKIVLVYLIQFIFEQKKLCYFMCVLLYQEEPPTSCDDSLPDISVDDVRLLQQMAPDLMAELHIGDSLESSMFKDEKMHLFFEERFKKGNFLMQTCGYF